MQCDDSFVRFDQYFVILMNSIAAGDFQFSFGEKVLYYKNKFFPRIGTQTQNRVKICNLSNVVGLIRLS